MKITHSAQIKAKNIDWSSLGSRIKQFRTYKNLSEEEAGKMLGIREKHVSLLEKGFTKERKSANIVWKASQVWNLSLNWLLNGIGSFHSPDPVELLPATLIIEKGAGIRRDPLRAQAEEGAYTDETFEFVMAIDKFKTLNNIIFPSWTQIYELIIALGYRKSIPGRIAPLGYLLDQQKLAEELKQLEESIEPYTSEEDDSLEHQVVYEHARKKTLTKRTLWKKNVTKPCFICGSEMRPSPKNTQLTWEKRKVCSRACKNKIISIWSDEEIKILRENYYEKGMNVSALLPKKVDNQIKYKVLREGLKVKSDLLRKGSPSLLTNKQQSIVRDNYPTIGTDICKLPEMSNIDPTQLRSWCYRHKIKCKPERKKKPRNWNPAEESKPCSQCGELTRPKQNDGRAHWSQRKLCGECRKKHIDATRKGGSSVNWTNEMDDIIRAEYLTTKCQVLAKKLAVSESLLYKRAKKLRIVQPRGTKQYLYQSNDEAILRKWYPSLGAVKLKKRFFGDRPEVTPTRIRQRTETLQIIRAKDRFNFSPEDDQIIRQNYPGMGIKCLALLTHNPNATRHRIAKRAAMLNVRRVKSSE